MLEDTLTLVMAAERGTGLDALTLHRPKAALPFGGKYRVVDFALANCLHSGLRQVLVLTQYKSHSLHKHLRDGWSVFNPELGEFITPVPPQMREGAAWYQGGVDAIRQNRFLLERSRARDVLVLDAGAIYRMDYAAMITAHRDAGSRATVALREVGEGAEEGVRVADDERVLALDDSNNFNALSMGVYLFDKVALLDALERHSEGEPGDLERGLVARMIDQGGVRGYRFGGEEGRVTPDRYWCGLTSVDELYGANTALLEAEPQLDLYQADWNIRTYQGQFPPARTVPGASGTEGIFVNSILAAGTVIRGGGVNHSVLFPRVQVADGAIVDSAILFDGVRVGENCRVQNCIVDKDVVIPPDVEIGLDAVADDARFERSRSGVSLVPKGYSFQ